jgi:tetratricopeptide (TPR) repeat protein
MGMTRYIQISVLICFSTILHAQDNLIHKADSLIFKSRFSEAAGVLRKYVKTNKKPSAFLKLGICYKNLVKNNLALFSLKEAEKLDSNNMDILINLGSVYSSLGFQNKAIEAFEKTISIDSTNLFVAINLGRLYLEQNKFEKSKAIYNNLLAEDSTNSFYHKQLGNIFRQENNLESALLHFKKAFEYNPNDVSVISNLSKTYYYSEQPDSSLSVLEKGLSVFKNSTPLLKIKADIKYVQKEYFEAVNTIVKIIANGDESAQLYQHLGVCYYQIALENFVGEAQVKKYNSAVDALQKSFAIDSTQALTALYLGMTYKELNENEKAKEYLNKALSLLHPKYTSVIFTNLAIVQSRENDFSEAIKNFKKAMKFEKENPNLYYYLASVYDNFYYDKKVPMIYYKIFLRKSDEKESNIYKYAEKRIEELQETIHFLNGHKSN